VPSSFKLPGQFDASEQHKRIGVQCKEGRIEEGSPAWGAMSEADQKRRKRAAAEMSTKLRSPNFFVSRTRLCVRNIPFALDEKALKQLIVDAVRQC
jgi:nucleolar protein 4